MAERNFTDADIKALGKEIGSAIGKGGGGGGQTPPPSSKGLKDIDEAATKAASDLNPFGLKLKTSGEYAADGLKAIKTAVDDGMGTWRDLSKSGVSFNNDIIGMTTAAAGSRLPLADFASVVKDNAANFAGLGGSVTRGAEAFAKMSKGFFESGATDNLKQLGYSSKDLNEMLALQAISVRGIVKNDEERNRVAFEGANKLATEMDAMAKLTGKSREVQMEAMKKQQTDMQFDAAIRLKASEIADPVKRAEFEANARDQLRKAEMDGRGQMFKEYFAFGNVISKEAGQQAALMQGQANATREAAMTSANAKLDSDARMRQADEAQEKARLEAVKDANDKNVLQMRQLGAAGGPVADAYNKQALVMDTYTKAVERAALENGYDIKTKEGLAAAQAKANEEVKKAAAGQNAQGVQVDGSTKAIVQFGNSVEHIRAGMIKGLLDPINEKISPQLSRLGDNLRELNSNFQGRGNLGAQVERAARSGVEAGANDKPAGDRRAQPVGETGILGAVQFGSRVIGGGANLAEKGLKLGNDELFENKTPSTPKPKQFAHGTMGVNGKLFEDFGTGTLAELHGLEAVVRPEDFKNIFKSSLGGIGQAVEKSTSKMQMPSMNGIDLGSISKEISTSISGGLSSSIKLSASDIADMTKPFEKGFDDFGSNFDDVVAKMATDMQDAMPLDAMDQTAAALEFASSRRQELEAIMNDGMARSGAEWNEIFDEAEQLDGQIEKLTNKQLDAMSKYSDGWSDTSDLMNQVYADIDDAMPIDTEFGDLEGAIAKNKIDDDQRAALAAWENAEMATLPSESDSESAMRSLVEGSSPTSAQADSGKNISMDSFTMSKTGMPIFKPKSTASAVPDKKKEEKTASPGKAINPETGEEYTPVDSASPTAKTTTKETKSSTSDSKAATLDDLLKSMNALNTKVAQLIAVNEDGHKSTAKAAKSSSANLYS